MKLLDLKERELNMANMDYGKFKYKSDQLRHEYQNKVNRIKMDTNDTLRLLKNEYKRNVLELQNKFHEASKSKFAKNVKKFNKR
jgi:hypothetical protein